VKVVDDFQKAKNACYRLLKVRQRSAKELRDRLKLKGFAAEVIEEVLVCLVQTGLVDDEAFARAWVEARIRKPLGVHRLYAELAVKGIDKQIIERVLEEHNNPQQEVQAIRQLLEKKKTQLRGLDKKKMKERLWGFFLRKGFSKDTVFDILNKL